MGAGANLVREQILVAAGRPLALTQDQVRLTGAAIECRINAEDPTRGFAPRPGLIAEFVPPGGPFVRVDTHAFPDYAMPVEYDSLLAKIVAWAPERDQARIRLDRALAELRVGGPGVCTTREAVREMLADPVFRAGRHTTALLEQDSRA